MALRRVRDIEHEFEELNDCCKTSLKKFIGGSDGEGVASVPLGGVVLLPFRVTACRVNTRPQTPEVLVDLVKIDLYGEEESELTLEDIYLWPGNAVVIDDVSEISILIPEKYTFERPVADSVESIELSPQFPPAKEQLKSASKRVGRSVSKK